jgi:hypothetical protein
MVFYTGSRARREKVTGKKCTEKIRPTWLRRGKARFYVLGGRRIFTHRGEGAFLTVPDPSKAGYNPWLSAARWHHSAPVYNPGHFQPKTLSSGEFDL